MNFYFSTKKKAKAKVKVAPKIAEQVTEHMPETLIEFTFNLGTKLYISSKVEKILKASLDLIPSPSVKIQIMGGKVCLRCKSKTLLGICQQTFENKKLTSPSNVLPYYLK